MNTGRKRNIVTIAISNSEKQEIAEKREVIRQAGIQYTHKYIYLYGLNILFDKAKQIKSI